MEDHGKVIREACPARKALIEAKRVMDHFGDVLNGMDCLKEIEEETGVSNDWVNSVFEQVSVALQLDCPCPPVRQRCPSPAHTSSRPKGQRLRG